VISLSEPVGGSRTAWGVPIHWQIVSRAGSRQVAYVIGRQAAGFVTTVPLPESLAGGTYELDIDGAPGSAGPAVPFGNAQRGRVITDDGSSIPISQYLEGLGQECRTSDNSTATWVGRILVGWLAGVVFFVVISLILVLCRMLAPGRVDLPHRLHTQAALGGLALGLAAIAVMTLKHEPHPAGLPRNLLPSGKPNPGPLTPSLRAGQRVLARFDSADAPGQMLGSTTFQADGRYVMYVGCDRMSVQVSEGYETPDVAHGYRTVALLQPRGPGP
jgi:hypothetical protein